MKIKLKYSFFLTCLFWQVISIPSFAQSVEYINGKVIDPTTMYPIPFATIALKENHLGVYANAEGDFQIIRNPDFQSDSLIITSIGYQRTTLGYKNLSSKEVNKIYLKPTDYLIKGVEIVALRKKLGSKKILRKALKNITQNYHVKPFGFVSYYRDYQKKDKDYINLNEAIVQIKDNGFNTESYFNKYRLFDYKNNMDFPRMQIPFLYDTINSPNFNKPNKYIPSATLPSQGGNELFILSIHDAIRNFKLNSFSFINTFSKDFLLNHSFSEITPVYNDNLLLYKISFNAKRWLTGDYLFASGDIYIQPKDYSIHKLEYSGLYLTKEKEKKQMFNVKIEYGYEDDIDSLMCLKYISFNNVFNIVDANDTTYFRVNKTFLDTSNRFNPVFVVNFNHKINSVTAGKKENYKVMFGDNEVKVENIYVGDKHVVVRIKEKNKEFSKYRMNIQNIKDIDGRILNERKKIEFFQYRELFVQEYNKLIPDEDSCYLRNIPLQQNCISKHTGAEKYWMNTPENIKK